MPAISLSTRSAALLLHHLALAGERSGRRWRSERIRSDSRSSTVSQRLGGEVLVVHGHVVGWCTRWSGRRCDSSTSVELLRAVLLRPVEHHVLEEVADAGDARALVARAHLEEGVEAHHRRVVVGHQPDPEAVGEAGLQDGEELSLVLFASAHGEGPAYRPPGAFAPTSRAFRGRRRTRSRTRRTPPHAVPVGAPGSIPGNVPPPRWGRPPGRPGRPCGAQASAPAAARACAAGLPARRCDRAARCPRFDRHGRARSPLALRCQRGRSSRKKPDFPGNTPDHRCSAATTLPPSPAAPPRRPAHPPLAARGRSRPGGGPASALRCRARPPAGRGGADAGGARPAGVRQPQPAHGATSSWSASTWTTRWPSTTCGGSSSSRST